MTAVHGIGPGGEYSWGPPQDEPAFFYVLNFYNTSAEKVAYLESLNYESMSYEERAALYYHILLEKSSLDDPGDLSEDFSKLVALPSSQTLNAYKQLGNICMVFLKLRLPTAGIYLPEMKELLDEIDNVKERCSQSQSWCLNDMATLKTSIRTWLECPILHYIRNHVNTSLTAVPEKVTGIFLNIVMRYHFVEGPQDEHLKLQFQPYETIHPLDKQIISIWGRTPFYPNVSLGIALDLEMKTNNDVWHSPLSIEIEP